MSHIEGTIYCDGCGAEITWTPFIFKKQEFCCEDCARGFECTCGDRMELGEEIRAAHTYPSLDLPV